MKAYLRQSAGVRRLALAVAAAAAGWGVPAGDALAGIVFQTREISIRADGPGPQSERTSANLFFSDTATSTATGDNFTNQTIVSLDATGDQDGISYRGFFDFSVEDARTVSDPEQTPLIDPEGTISVRTVFSLDTPYAYTLRYGLDRPTEEPGLSIMTDSDARFIVQGEESNSLLSDGEERSGVLQPGQYTLSFDRRVEGFATPPTSADFVETFDLRLDLVPVDGGPGPNPNPIPLPPAVWSGLIALGCSGAIGLIRRRKLLA